MVGSGERKEWWGVVRGRSGVVGSGGGGGVLGGW